MEIGDTSVKVGVRVRPLSSSEVNDGSSTCLSYLNEENQLIIGNDKLFGFDYVFKETDSQEYVYRKAALPMVENILKGYNATLFAYGQTGSGKTYTMGTCISESVIEGSAGIVPRIIKDLFEKMPNYEYEYTVKVSFLEIYKEDIHDLLGEDVSASLQIREENQLVKIPGLTETVVTSPEEVLYLLHCGSTKRSVASTAMNLKSSRSHAILTLCFLLRPKITQLDGESTEDTLTAKLHLVDLAGSERIKKTHAEGDRLKEGIDINRGLLALGNVISALCERDAKKRSHIPYRDSRLTRLLQDSLGGNSATLMLACVSPADINMEETLNTLRYADRARLIKNKPILNRADPKDAELAKLRVLVAQLQARLTNGSSCFPLLSPCPKTIIKPLSATTINNNSTNSQFSSELVTNLMNKNRKLESEKLLLCAELDQTVEKMNELYRNNFDADNLRDTVISELQKVESILNSLKQFVRDKFNESPELISYIQELEDILTGLIKIFNESNKITNEDLEHAYKQSSDFLAEFQSDSTCFDAEEVVEKTALNIHTEIDVNNNANCISNLSSIKTTAQPQLVDRWGSELRARRLECKQRIETIEATIRQKNVLLTSLEAAAEQGDESYCLLLKKYESQIRELESKVIDLEREKSKLLAEHSNEELKDSKMQREARLKTMEQELNQTRRQLTELSRLKKAKEAREAECLRLRNEIQSLKSSMIRSAKQLKEESTAYRKWRKEKETEVKKLQEHDRRLQCEMSRMVSVHERQQAVLKRRIEAAAAAERRLKELLLRQKDIRNERDKRVSEGNNAKNRFDLATRVRAWVKTDLDIQISMDAVRYHLSHFMDSRKTLCDRLRTIEAKMESCRQDGQPYDMYIEEVNSLTESIQCQTQQISDLQQKLMDAGERSSTDASGPPDSTGQMLSSRLSQLHNIQEARIALKYLFRQASSSEVSKINLETQIDELESQLNAEKQKVENLLQTTEHYSVELLKSEENMKDIQSRLQAANEHIDQLEKENAELREASKIQHDNLMKIRSLMTNSSSTTGLTVENKLSNTPVLRQYSSTNNCTFTLLSDDENENVYPQTNIPTDKSLNFTDDLNNNDGGEPGVKLKKVESDWSLSFTVVTDINSNTDADSHQPRCKCRRTCQARCSCKRSGRPCIPSHCHCVLGLCKNRSDSSSENSKILSSVDNSATVMGPPSGFPKRKTRALHLNLNKEQQNEHDAHTMMNETYDLNKQQSPASISESNDNDDLQSPTSNSQLSDGGSLRYLWPKNRLSYFPSPLLRSDR
uniref:Kinesin motor domain-containing protein n=1 Tax=Schistosoma mansoni TaxID=6183 RepID=A0A5K4F4S8_SCHMA